MLEFTPPYDRHLIISLTIVQVQEAVSTYGIKESEKSGSGKRYNTHQMPKIISTLTEFRKLYLRPGVNMSTNTHPSDVINPVTPQQPTTNIAFLTGRLCLLSATDSFTPTFSNNNIGLSMCGIFG